MGPPQTALPGGIPSPWAPARRARAGLPPPSPYRAKPPLLQPPPGRGDWQQNPTAQHSSGTGPFFLLTISQLAADSFLYPIFIVASPASERHFDKRIERDFFFFKSLQLLLEEPACRGAAHPPPDPAFPQLAAPPGGPGAPLQARASSSSHPSTCARR